MDGITTLGLAAGALTTIAFVPQLVKAWNSKSTGDLSWGMVATFSSGVVLWIVFGIGIHSLPIIVTNTVTLILQLCLVALKVKYG